MSWLPLKRIGSLLRLWTRSRSAPLRQWAGNDYAQLRHLADWLWSTPADMLTDPPWYPKTVGPPLIDLRTAGVCDTSFIPLCPHANSPPPPEGCAELREAIVTHGPGFSRLHPQEIMITLGASGAYNALLDSCLNHGDRVLLFDPCSPLFIWGLRYRNITISWIPTWIEGNWCRFPRTMLEQHIRHVRLIVLADPVNPTGSLFHPEDRDYLAWLAVAHDVLIYVDHSLALLHAEGNAADWRTIDGLASHLVTAGSLSWLGGQWGWRIGWLSGPRLLRQACRLVLNRQAISIPTPCQLSAARWLQATNPPQHSRLVQRLARQRQEAIDLLQPLGWEFGDCGQGSFLWASTDHLDINGGQCAELLQQQHHLLVLPGHWCGPSGQKMIRLCLLQHYNAWQEALHRLSQFTITRGTRYPLPLSASAAPPAIGPLAEALSAPRESITK